MDSKLTTGGAYVTGETITSFKGYYRDSAGKYVALIRSFVQFDGEGDTANARPRAIGGHPAVVVAGQSVFEKIRTARTRTRTVTFRLEQLVNYSRRPQQRLHQLVAVGRRANHPDDEGQADDALHLS